MTLRSLGRNGNKGLCVFKIWYMDKLCVEMEDDANAQQIKLIFINIIVLS